MWLPPATWLFTGTNPNQPPAKTRISFYTDQATSYEAELLEHQAEHDLALLRVASPSGYSWDRQCLARPGEQSRGTEVWFIGRDQTWYVPAGAGLISSEGPSADQWLEIDLPGLRPGSSGGPVVTKSGILGMVKAQTTDDTRVLSLEFIRKAVQDWGYPWQLTTAPARYDGEWAGTLHYSLPLIFHLSTDGKGSCDSPSQNAYSMPVEYTVQGNALSLVVPSVNASYAGVIGNGEANGTFIQNGARLPLRLTLNNQEHITASAGIAGDWKGALEFNLPIVFHLGTDGKGTSDSPTQNSYGIPVDYETRELTVVLRMPSIGASYTATANSTETEMNGTFTQNNSTLRLQYKRRSKNRPHYAAEAA